MPQWEITDNHTGDTFTIESEEAPTQDYLSDYIKKQDDQSALEKSNAAFRGVKLSPYEQQVLGMGGRVSEPPAVDVPELLQQLKATSAGAGGLLEKGAEEALILPQRLKEMVSPTPGTELQSMEERLGPSRQAAKEVLGSPLGVPALAPPPEDVEGEGVGPTLRRFGYEMSKPVSAGLLLATPENELIKAGFGAQMAGDTAEAVKNLAGSQTPEEVKGRLADVVLKGGMAAMLGKGHPEKIVSAAVKDAEGNVHTGANHPEIVKDLGLKGFDDRESRNTPDFGYVTESGKFITRPQAALLSKKTGQQLEPFDVDSKGVEQPHSDEIASPVEPDKALGDVPQPVTEKPTEAPAKPYFDPQSEALGLGRPSTAPTVEDVRAQRAAEAGLASQDLPRAEEPKEVSGGGQIMGESEWNDTHGERPPQNLGSGIRTGPGGRPIDLKRSQAIRNRKGREMSERNKRAYVEYVRKELENGKPVRDEFLRSWANMAGRDVSEPLLEKYGYTKKPNGAWMEPAGTETDTILKPSTSEPPAAPPVPKAKETSIPVWKVSYTDIETRNARRPFYKLSVLSEGNTRAEAVQRVKDFHGNSSRYGEFRASKSEPGTKADYQFQAPKETPPTEPPLPESKVPETQAITPPPVEPPTTPAPPPTPQPAEGGGGKYGIAQRVRDERAAAGVVDPVEPGKGVSAPDSVEHGRELLAKDPQAGVKALAAFEADPQKAISHDTMAATRAHGEYLQKAATDMENRYGTDSEQYQKARKELSDWDKRTKPLQTEWAKIGKAQQGETDIDTGSFTGLSRAYEQATGETFTPEQEKTAKDIAGKKKKADQSADVAAAELKNQLTKEATSPEQAALDAASKTVRENAIRLAEAENKARVADEKLKQATAKIQEDAKRKAESANSQTVIEAARRLAAAERMAAATPNDPAANARVKAAKVALDAAHKTVREAAVRAAAEENAGRVKAAEKAKKIADFQLKAAKGAQDAAQKRVTDTARTAAEKQRKAQAMDPRTKVLIKVRDYIENLGMDDIDDIRNKLATELGMSLKQVTTLLGQSKRVKFMLDDVWKKKQVQRRLEQTAKRWLTEQEYPKWRRALSFVPRVLFGLKVGFHGTVALGTHAPTKAFDPRFWKVYGANFAKMYRMVGSRSYYERTMQDLVRRPNYTIARRAGLQNDPFQYEEFADPGMTVSGGAVAASTAGKISKPFAQAYNAMTAMGNRGYSVLKVLRQDMFDQHWGNLPKTLQFPEMAEAVSDAVNHDTGVTKTKAPGGTEVALFAPRLAASRVAWLAVDPAKAAATFANWKNAGQADKWAAMEQVKSKAWVGGTLFGLLALNQGMLSATDSDQKVNFTDPFHADFLKFKVGGMSLAYGNPMLTMMRLPVRLFKIRESDGGKLKNLVYPDENTYTVLGEYARSQLSPFASLATTLWMKGDWQNRPLPNSDRPIPKRLRAQGIEPYTWPEFWAEQVAPIPVEEAMREVWKTGMGMNDEQYKEMRKAFATWSVMTATGARLNEDIPYGKSVPTPLP